MYYITSAGDASAVGGVVWYRWKEEGLEMHGKSETTGLYRGGLRISGSRSNPIDPFLNEISALI